MARSAPPARGFELSSTVDGVRLELGDAAVSPAELIRRILVRHSDYGAHTAAAPEHTAAALTIAWPEGERTARADEWLDRAARLFQPDALPRFHGRAVILALALLEPRTGRVAVASGLFTLIAREITPALPEALSDEGWKLLRRLPLAATIVGAALPQKLDADDVHAVAFHPDCSSLVTGDAAGQIRTFDLSDGTETARIEVGGAVTALAISPDGGHLVAGGDFGAGVWTFDGHLVVTLPVSPPVHAVAFASDIPEVAVGGDSGATTWYVGDVEKPVRIVEEGAAVYAVAYSPDGGRLALGLGGGARLHPARLPPEPPAERPPETKRNPVRPPEPHPETLHQGSSSVRAIAFSPDGSRIVTGDDVGLARLWDAQARSELGVFAHTEADVIAVGFTADSALLVTASTIPSVHIWSIETGVEVARLHTGSSDMAADIAVSSDGKLLAMANGPALLWQAGLGGRDFRLSGYTADDARRGTDLLRIGDDVDAFAQLMATRTITPPLSIGIFGDWGSGKSFFMNQLKSRVDQLAREARESGERQRDISFYKRIVQVEFNAWHYSESDLWASLVEHILANLRIEPDEKLDIVAGRQQRLLDQLSIEVEAADRASKKEKDAQKRLEDAEKELQQAKKDQKQLREELATAAGEDPLTLIVDSETRDAIYRALDAAGFPQVGKAARELDAAAREARTTLERRKVLAPLASAPDKKSRFRILVLLLVAAPALAVTAAAVAWALGFGELASVSAAATGIATLLSTGARWIRSQVEWTTQRLNDLDEAAKRLEAPMRQALAEQRSKQVRLEKELEALLEQQRAAQLEKAAQLDRVQEVEAELAAATPSRLLSRFLQDRVESDDYRKRLGVLALVRRDFEAISAYLEKQTKEVEKSKTLEDEEQDADFRINRIVLYIDDLDRCPPKTVVEVLQAVHLLLAFPLFVVVVAVDVRWVSRSLAKQYPDLLRGDADGEDNEWDAAAPRDYLEKIFQIPFWIEPLNARASRRMLRGLIGRVAADDGAEHGPAATAGARSDGRAGDDADTDAATRRAGAAGPAGGGAAAAPRALANASPPDLNPESLDLRPPEIKFMEELAPIVGRTPRAVKRYVNTYRLIKATVRDVRRFVLDDDTLSPHRIVMLLLAIETGLRSVAGPLLEVILDTAEEHSATKPFRDALDKAKGRAEKDEVERLEAWLRGQHGAWERVPVGVLAEWADDVARFSFASGPL